MPARPRQRASQRFLQVATELTPPHARVRKFARSIVGAGDVLLVAGQFDEHTPFAAQYRMKSAGAVRERTFRGAPDHEGPCIATDGVRVVVGQPHASATSCFAQVFVQQGSELSLEATLPGRHEAAPAGFGERVAIERDLLAVAHRDSVSVYRHSPVGWLLAGTPQPALPYAWNPHLAATLGVVAGRVLVANPVEIDGHRAGPGRVFVYRQRAQGSELESVLSGDGIECGREEPFRIGFGAHVQVSGEFAVITAPFELSSDGQQRSRVYVFRAQSGTLTRVAAITVPSCSYGACLVGERLCVLGDELYVFARRGHSYEPHATYAAPGAQSITRCGDLVALAYPREERVSLHFAAQL